MTLFLTIYIYIYNYMRSRDISYTSYTLHRHPRPNDIMLKCRHWEYIEPVISPNIKFAQLKTLFSYYKVLLYRFELVSVRWIQSILNGHRALHVSPGRSVCVIVFIMEITSSTRVDGGSGFRPPLHLFHLLGEGRERVERTPLLFWQLEH